MRVLHRGTLIAVTGDTDLQGERLSVVALHQLAATMEQPQWMRTEHMMFLPPIGRTTNGRVRERDGQLEVVADFEVFDPESYGLIHDLELAGDPIGTAEGDATPAPSMPLTLDGPFARLAFDPYSTDAVAARDAVQDAPPSVAVTAGMRRKGVAAIPVIAVTILGSSALAYFTKGFMTKLGEHAAETCIAAVREGVDYLKSACAGLLNAPKQPGLQALHLDFRLPGSTSVSAYALNPSMEEVAGVLDSLPVLNAHLTHIEPEFQRVGIDAVTYEFDRATGAWYPRHFEGGTDKVYVTDTDRLKEMIQGIDLEHSAISVGFMVSDGKPEAGEGTNEERS